jgi:hypothetical protein
MFHSIFFLFLIARALSDRNEEVNQKFKRVQESCLALPSAGAASCSSPYTANQQGARVVALNTLPFPIVISYLDSYGREHPRFGVPPHCKRQFVAAAGSAWRARPVSNRDYSSSCQTSNSGLRKLRPKRKMRSSEDGLVNSTPTSLVEEEEEEEEEPAEFFGIQDAPISSNSAADFFIRAESDLQSSFYNKVRGEGTPSDSKRGKNNGVRYDSFSFSDLHSFCLSLQESSMKFDEMIAAAEDQEQLKSITNSDEGKDEEEDNVVEANKGEEEAVVQAGMKLSNQDEVGSSSCMNASGTADNKHSFNNCGHQQRSTRSTYKRPRIREFVTISSSDMCNAKNNPSDISQPSPPPPLFNFNAWASSTGIELDFDFLEKIDLNHSTLDSSSSTSSSKSRSFSRSSPSQGDETSEDDDEHVREVLKDNKEADAATSNEDSLEPSEKRKASLSFKWKTPHGTHPTVRHEGLTFNIKSKLGDFLRPRTLTGKFKRSERCPVCNWDLHNETHRLDVAAEMINVDGGFRPVKLAPCPTCAGEGYLEYSSVFSIENSTSTFAKREGEGGRGGEGGIDEERGQHHHHHHHHSLGKQRLKTNCPSCHGTGTVPASSEAKIASKDEILPLTCPYCDGKRYIDAERSHVAELAAGMPTYWATRIEGAGGVAASRLPGELLIQLETEIGPPHYKDSWAEDGETIAEVLKLNVSRINIMNNVTRERENNPFRSIQFSNHTSIAAASAARAALSLFSVLPFNASWSIAELDGSGGPHLLMKLTISLDEAVNGFRYHIATLRHTYATLRPVSLPIMPGDVFIIPGGGLPVYLPGKCTWNLKSVPCAPPTPRKKEEDVDDPQSGSRSAGSRDKKDPMPWETKCDFSGEQANEDCPAATYRATWKKTYAAYAQSCIDLETGSRYPAALPGASTLHSLLSGQPAWPPHFDSKAQSQQHTHTVCQVSQDSSVFDFPHGHLIVKIDVNADNFLLGMKSSDTTRDNNDNNDTSDTTGAGVRSTSASELDVGELIRQIYDRVQRRRQSA